LDQLPIIRFESDAPVGVWVRCRQNDPGANHRRLYEYCGDIPPADLETAYYAHHDAQRIAELSLD
jgi:hypothetical protein